MVRHFRGLSTALPSIFKGSDGLGLKDGAEVSRKGLCVRACFNGLWCDRSYSLSCYVSHCHKSQNMSSTVVTGALMNTYTAHT